MNRLWRKKLFRIIIISLLDFFIKTIKDDALFVIIISDRIRDIVGKEITFKIGKEKVINSE